MDDLLLFSGGGEMPLLTAFLLGLLTAVSPCPLATNMVAVGYVAREVSRRRAVLWNGLLYTLGRLLSYVLLGTVLVVLLRQGMDTFKVEYEVSRWGEYLLPPFLIVAGVLMGVGDRISLPQWGGLPDVAPRLRGGMGSFLLGMGFALAFCPTSGWLFFGTLIPLSVVAREGLLLVWIYAVATGLPVAVAAWLLAYGMGSLGSFYRRVQVVRRWLNRLVALAFLLLGCYYGYMIYG